MLQNLVLNNSDHDFAVHWAYVQADTDQTKVEATPGTDAQVTASLRSQLASSQLTDGPQSANPLLSAGIAAHADYKA